MEGEAWLAGMGLFVLACSPSDTIHDATAKGYAKIPPDILYKHNLAGGGDTGVLRHALRTPLHGDVQTRIVNPSGNPELVVSLLQYPGFPGFSPANHTMVELAFVDGREEPDSGPPPFLSPVQILQYPPPDETQVVAGLLRGFEWQRVDADVQLTVDTDFDAPGRVWRLDAEGIGAWAFLEQVEQTGLAIVGPDGRPVGESGVMELGTLVPNGNPFDFDFSVRNLNLGTQGIGVRVEPDNAAWSVESNCASTRPLDTCTVHGRLALAQLETGTQTATVVVYDLANADLSTRFTLHTDVGVPLRISPAEREVQFRGVAPRARQSQLFELTNPAAAVMSPLTARIVGDSAFAIESSTCDQVLGAGESCQVSVAFQPPSLGRFFGHLEIASAWQGTVAAFQPALVGEAAVSEPAAPALTVIGPAGSLVPNGGTFDLGGVIVGDPAVAVLTLQNTSSRSQTPTLDVEPDGDGWTVGDICPSIEPGGRCSIRVSLEAGSESAIRRLTLALGGDGSEATRVEVTARALPPASVEPGDLQFFTTDAGGSGPSGPPPRDIRLTNEGEGPLGPLDVTLVGDPKFQIAGSTCSGSVVAPHASCTLTVAYSGSSDSEPHFGHVEISTPWQRSVTRADPLLRGDDGRCGDGFTSPDEGCDDGNAIDTDGCTNACTPALCGDGVVAAATEACDDGDRIDTDECTNACTLPSCGDAIVFRGVEQCDDGNRVDDDDCSNACTLPSCGDGVLVEPEECDDGDDIDTNGCTNACALPVCGDRIVSSATEQCDDGDRVDTDECTNACTLPSCGDFIIQLGVEQCDDGNTLPGDGCSPACEIEAPTFGRCRDCAKTLCSAQLAQIEQSPADDRALSDDYLRCAFSPDWLLGAPAAEGACSNSGGALFCVCGQLSDPNCREIGGSGSGVCWAQAVRGTACDGIPACTVANMTDPSSPAGRANLLLLCERDACLFDCFGRDP